MGIEQLTLIILGALAGGFVSGLAGFGTGNRRKHLALCCVATRRRFSSRGVLGHSASPNPAHDLALYRERAAIDVPVLCRHTLSARIDPWFGEVRNR